MPFEPNFMACNRQIPSENLKNSIYNPYLGCATGSSPPRTQNIAFITHFRGVQQAASIRDPPKCPLQPKFPRCTRQLPAGFSGGAGSLGCAEFFALIYSKLCLAASQQQTVARGWLSLGFSLIPSKCSSRASLRS